jgi:hypothetical protein
MKLRANGLHHEVLRWPAEPTGDAPPKPFPVLLLHGFMDAACSFEASATALSHAGYTVYAPDLRGFGDSDRVPAGGYYHFPDYVADVAGLVELLSPDAPVLLVGHSMGGTVATLFAGACPERVAKLALLEGLGPPVVPPDLAPLRMRRWLTDLDKLRARGDERPMSFEQAVARLKSNHARLPDALLAERARPLLREREGGLVWAFDPLHRTTSPSGFAIEAHRAFAAAVTCPVLYVSGGSLGYRSGDEDERLAAFARIDRFDLPDAGHMMHWTEPTALAARLLTFFSDS